MWELGIVKKG